MSPAPDRETLRATLAAFDERQTKIVGGVLAVMFKTPEKVRDREWIAEQFTEVCLLAGQFEEVEEAQGYIQEAIHPLLNACYGLFQVVGEDLAPRAGEGLTTMDAMQQALSYFVSAEGPEGPESPQA